MTLFIWFYFSNVISPLHRGTSMAMRERTFKFLQMTVAWLLTLLTFNRGCICCHGHLEWHHFAQRMTHLSWH